MIPELRETDLHVWRLRLDSASLVYPDPGFNLDWLDAEEQGRAERLTQPAARHAFILTRVYLRGLLGRYLGVPPAAVRLIRNAHGKPRLAGLEERQGLVFNVSHSGDRAVLAFALDTPLGVDVEHLHPRRDLERLAAHCLSAGELERWGRLPAERKPADFIRCWTAKESFVKATGRGIALGLRSIALAEGAAAFATVPPPYGAAGDWILRTWRMGEYQYALVHGQPERSILFFPNDPEAPMDPD